VQRAKALSREGYAQKSLYNFIVTLYVVFVKMKNAIYSFGLQNASQDDWAGYQITICQIVI